MFSGRILRLGVGFSAEPTSFLRLRFFRWGRCFGWFLFFRSRLLRFCRCGLRFRFLRLWFSFFALRLFVFRRLFLYHLSHINPLDESHGSRVALTLAKLHDAGISAIALRRLWRDIVKQFFYRILLAQRRQGGAAGVDRAIFSERDHPFRERTNCLRLGQRGLDALMFDQGANLISQQRFTVLSRATELNRLFLVSHDAANVSLDDAYSSPTAPLGPAPSPLTGTSRRPGSNFMPRLKPSCCSLSLISFNDFLPKLRYFSISASVFCASCPTVVMFALFKQLAARTLSSISFTLILSSFLSFRF